MKCIENIFYLIFSTELNQKTCVFFRASVLLTQAYNPKTELTNHKRQVLAGLKYC